MTASPLLTAILPIALGIIMLGLGLSLTLVVFTRGVKFPRRGICNKLNTRTK